MIIPLTTPPYVIIIIIIESHSFSLTSLLSLNHRDLNPSHIGSTYEFMDCPTQSGYVADGCKGCPDGDECVNLPYTYVGEYLFFSGGLPYSYCIKDGKILDANN